MRLFLRSLVVLCLLAIAAQAQNFKHVVVIVQENRTPDNLFYGLCLAPLGGPERCNTKPNNSQYNIQTRNWLDVTNTRPPKPGEHPPSYPGGVFLVPVQPTPQPLKSTPHVNDYDLDHSHTAFVSMCDFDPSAKRCMMDGAARVKCSPAKGEACPIRPQYHYVQPGDVGPYLQLATQYGWANYMFQTNQGPSFPAHQFLFGGTSAPTAADDAKGIFASENVGRPGIGVPPVSGCISPTDLTVKTIEPSSSKEGYPGNESDKIYPCFDHKTLADLFTSGVTWRYYSPSAGSIWTAPTAIKDICQAQGETATQTGECKGKEWLDNVSVPKTGGGPAQILTDIKSCNLRSVSWVAPSCQNSDHAKCTDGNGPSWVASIVNEIGNNTTCDGSGYWKDTAIFITWDDWGGWYDHEPPTILPGVQGDYQYGFRVPLVVVSAYTPQGYINNNRHDFGSIIRFIEHNFGIQEGELHFSDARAKTDLEGFFNHSLPPRTFTTITAALKADFFLNDKRHMIDPDNDANDPNFQEPPRRPQNPRRPRGR